MKAEETNFLKFLSGPKQLVIPIYQRTYSWRFKECDELWKDIIKTGKDKDIAGHFVGSIVYIEKGLYHASSLPKLLVIDGQQRLTIVSLLISALCNFIKEKQIKTEISPDRLTSYFLLNDKEAGEDKYKLILTQSDKNSLFKVIENRKLAEEDSARIMENYDFFLKRICESDLNVIYEGIQKLIIIDVSLDREKDNPQLIFDSLNSTGLKLTQADQIRNYVLMGLDKPQQENIYQNFWYPMEKSFGHSENSELFDHFMRDYLTIKIGRIPTLRDIYSEFKQFSTSKEINELVSEIHEFSKYYVNIALGKETDEDIKSAFLDINDLRVDVSYPFILKIYHDFVTCKITKEELIQALRLIESYVFRRAICGVPTNSLNKTFATLYKEIDHQNFLESLQAILVLQDSYRRLPDDEEFKRELMIKDVYHFRNRNYLLRKLENHERKEIVNVESYTIEHVLPQNPNLSNEWKMELGDNWKEIQKVYLHTIGNLTLTGYNSEYQDRSFKEKRDLKDKNGLAIGFKDSPIRLNRSLANLENWNEKEVEKRAQEIAYLAINVWANPVVSTETLTKYRIEPKESNKNQDAKIPNENTEDYIARMETTEEIKALFLTSVEAIENLSSDISKETTETRVKYRTPNGDFVGVELRKNQIRFHLYFKRLPDNTDHVHISVRNQSESKSVIELCENGYKESLSKTKSRI